MKKECSTCMFSRVSYHTNYKGETRSKTKCKLIEGRNVVPKSHFCENYKPQKTEVINEN